MRQHGLVDVPDTVGLNGHACWGFDGPEQLASAAGPFLEEGQALGQRLMFVGGPAAEDVVRRVEPMRSLVETGELQVAPFDAVYPGGRRMPDDEQLAMYATTTEAAIADGYTGLRVLAEVTALAQPGHEVSGQVHWESFADRYMAEVPLAALCCFDRRIVPDRDLAAIARVHPTVDSRLRSLAPFNVYAQPGALALAGDVDACSAEALSRALALVLDGTEREVTLDLADLRFIEHTGMLAIARHRSALSEQGRTLQLRAESVGFRRLSEVLEIGL